MINTNYNNNLKKSIIDYIDSNDSLSLISKPSGIINSPINEKGFSTIDNTNQKLNNFDKKNENYLSSIEKNDNINTNQKILSDEENDSKILLDDYDESHFENKDISFNLEEDQKNGIFNMETQINKELFKTEICKKHTKFKKDNAHRRFIIKAIKMTHKYINEEIKILKKKCNKINKIIIKNDWKLYEPTITSELTEIHIDQLKDFVDNKILYFFENLSKPKICSEKNKNKRIIKEILEYEKNINENKMKKLLDIPFTSYLKAFLNNHTTISLDGIEIIKFNNEFKTLKDCLEDYPKIKKKIIKEYIEELIN